MDKFMFLKFLPFMEEDGKGGTGGGDPEGGSNDDGNNGGSEKTFTQEDLNRIAAKEKRDGIASILKTLGFEKEEDAKKFVETYRKAEEDKKDDLEKSKEATAKEKKLKEEAEAKANELEKKLKVVSQGVSSDKADDIIVLANAKEIDGKSFDDALEEVKKAYPSLFEGEQAGGTGHNGNPPRKGGKENNSSIGKRLAEQRKTGTQSKNSYFSH